MGTHNWTPSTAEAFNTSTSHRPSPHVEMLPPFGSLSLYTYDNTESFNKHQDESLPKLFLDVMAVREEVYPAEDLQVRVDQHHFVLSPTTVIQKYRGRKWAENALVNAVIEYLSYPNVADNPTTSTPTSSASEPEFGGLLYVLSDRTRKQFWHGAAGFKADKPAAVWKEFPFVGMYRWIKNDPAKRADLERARLKGRERARARAKAKSAHVARGNKRTLDEVEEENAEIDEDGSEMGEDAGDLEEDR
ncbi:hypothetical protein VSDG_04068 [Cytospora chrysosperma]|uniref:Uncharacterized protein n=1 Tax=Cytospora chrysosperma TaxID=252740 RepID=A0A423W0Y9_CYTCH|nr:hypothetical protein VSDG_04068 [Valsa sordida]